MLKSLFEYIFGRWCWPQECKWEKVKEFDCHRYGREHCLPYGQKWVMQCATCGEVKTIKV